MMIKTNEPTEKFAVVGHCPKCGAPIYGLPPKSAEGTPMNKYSCTCHQSSMRTSDNKITKYGKELPDVQ